MNNLVTSIYGPFERILRWAYPGMLFLVLLNLSQSPSFCIINAFGSQTWFLVIGALVIGAALYLIQSLVVTQLLTCIFQGLHWCVNEHPEAGDNPSILALHDKLPPWCCCLKWLATHWLDRDARTIELRCRRSKGDHYSYLDSSWAQFHSAFITAILIILFWFLKSANSTLSMLGEGIGCWFWLFPGLILLGAIVLFMRLTRVRHSNINDNSCYY